MIDKKPALLAILGATLATVVTFTMDATGYAPFSALPLFPIWLGFWAVQRFSRSELGLTIPREGVGYSLALLHPLLVMFVIAGIAWIFGEVDIVDVDWKKTAINIGLASSIGLLMVLITEEMFFRGWMWASLRRAGLGSTQILIWTSVAFTIWHISWATIADGFELPPHQAILYLANVFVFGMIWGAMRLLTGSVIIASIGHTVWNALAYSFFGTGPKIGALGIKNTLIFGPEIGLLGLTFNAIFLLGLWKLVNKQNRNKNCPSDEGRIET